MSIKIIHIIGFYWTYISLENETIANAMLEFYNSSKPKIIQIIYESF